MNFSAEPLRTDHGANVLGILDHLHFTKFFTVRRPKETGNFHRHIVPNSISDES